MLLMTKDDVSSYIEEVINLIANKLGIEKNEIERTNSNINAKMEEFKSAYQEWHNFHFDRDERRIDTPCTQEELEELERLISNRDSSRKELVDEVRKLDEVLRKTIEKENEMDGDLRSRSQKSREEKFKNPII